jgi:hypothetical protein
MTTQTAHETAEQAKARKNAEYEAMLDESFAQLERGECITMTFEKWEEWIKTV